MLARHTGQTVDHILKTTDRDYFMTAEEAKAFGIVDEVLTKPGDGGKK
ncbi:MAG: ATP-dependent Clp protease proteolytic subunit [Gemmataceae bacterium]